MSVTKPTITYFPLAGRAEVARIILEDAGVDYDFVAVTNWPELKAQQTASGKLAFGQVPLYEEPDLTIVQSGAIARHVARVHGYYGSNEKEAALIDQAYEGLNDVLGEVAKTIFGTPADQQAAAKEKLTKEYLPTQLGYLGRLLEKNGNNGHFVGSKLSFADVMLFVGLNMLFTRVPESRDPLLNVSPAVKKAFETVTERERIKAYLARNVYGQK